MSGLRVSGWDLAVPNRVLVDVGAASERLGLGGTGRRGDGACARGLEGGQVTGEAQYNAG